MTKNIPWSESISGAVHDTNVNLKAIIVVYKCLGKNWYILLGHHWVCKLQMDFLAVNNRVPSLSRPDANLHTSVLII